MGAAFLAASCSSTDSDDGRADGFPLPTTTLGATSDTGMGNSESGQPSQTGGTAPAADSTTEPPEDSDGPITFDVGNQPDAPDFDMGCRKVDFLFVVDNSGSMSAQQTQLLASFSGFITAIQASLEGTVDSYHVGVITSDNYSGNQPGCTSLGNLVTQTSGFGALGQVCTPFAEGNRFATEMDDLELKFPCMAQVGTSGSGIEQPVTATMAALDPANAVAGACNENFLRDDAILVLIILTDDPPYDPDFDDAHPGTDTSTWHDTVIAAKNDDPEAMVVIGFVPWTDVSCVFSNSESPNLINFVQSFGTQGVLASICEPDFGPTFTQTVETIVTTCENFDPPG